MSNHNLAHSADRVCSEHGNLSLKQWGVMRGRSDIDLFQSDPKFISAMKVCWGLSNFLIESRDDHIVD